MDVILLLLKSKKIMLCLVIVIVMMISYITITYEHKTDLSHLQILVIDDINDLTAINDALTKITNISTNSMSIPVLSSVIPESLINSDIINVLDANWDNEIMSISDKINLKINLKTDAEQTFKDVVKIINDLTSNIGRYTEKELTDNLDLDILEYVENTNSFYQKVLDIIEDTVSGGCSGSNAITLQLLLKIFDLSQVSNGLESLLHTYELTTDELINIIKKNDIECRTNYMVLNENERNIMDDLIKHLKANNPGCANYLEKNADYNGSHEKLLQ